MNGYIKLEFTSGYSGYLWQKVEDGVVTEYVTESGLSVVLPPNTESRVVGPLTETLE